MSLCRSAPLSPPSPPLVFPLRLCFLRCQGIAAGTSVYYFCKSFCIIALQPNSSVSFLARGNSLYYPQIWLWSVSYVNGIYQRKCPHQAVCSLTHNWYSLYNLNSFIGHCHTNYHHRHSFTTHHRLYFTIHPLLRHTHYSDSNSTRNYFQTSF